MRRRRFSSSRIVRSAHSILGGSRTNIDLTFNRSIAFLTSSGRSPKSSVVALSFFDGVLIREPSRAHMVRRETSGLTRLSDGGPIPGRSIRRRRRPISGNSKHFRLCAPLHDQPIAALRGAAAQAMCHADSFALYRCRRHGRGKARRSPWGLPSSRRENPGTMSESHVVSHWRLIRAMNTRIAPCAKGLPSIFPGKSKAPSRGRAARNSSSMVIATEESGTSCALPAFILGLGIRQTRTEKSNSSHRAPSASEGRIAVRIWSISGAAQGVFMARNCRTKSGTWAKGIAGWFRASRLPCFGRR